MRPPKTAPRYNARSFDSRRFWGAPELPVSTAANMIEAGQVNIY
jgi:hypothetical protein